MLKHTQKVCRKKHGGIWGLLFSYTDISVYYSLLSCNMSPIAVECCLILLTLSQRTNLWRRAEGQCFWFVLALALCPAIALMGDVSQGSSVPSCCFLPSVFWESCFCWLDFTFPLVTPTKLCECAHIWYSIYIIVLFVQLLPETLQRKNEWLLYLRNIWILIWVKYEIWGEEAWKKEDVCKDQTDCVWCCAVWCFRGKWKKSKWASPSLD